MESDSSAQDGWDQNDDVLAGPGGESVLDAFDVYVPAGEIDDMDDAWDALSPMADEGDDEVLTPRCMVTNPPGTVSVTVLLDGRILGVNLSPRVASMSELQLAEEITVIASLARQQARAAQHSLIAEFMSELGHDRVATSGFLEHDLGLPSPSSVNSERAQIFATRYAGDNE
jgi:hypothetical protein